MTSYIYKLWYGENSPPTPSTKGTSSEESPVQKQNTSLVYPLYDDVQKLRADIERVLKFEDTLLHLEHKIERVQVKFKSIEERMKAIERMAGV